MTKDWNKIVKSQKRVIAELKLQNRQLEEIANDYERKYASLAKDWMFYFGGMKRLMERTGERRRASLGKGT